MKLFFLFLCTFAGNALANTSLDNYVVAYDWHISELMPCTYNAYCSDTNAFNGRRFVDDGSDVTLDMEPWVITFLINKIDKKQYEIQGKATNKDNKLVAHFSSIGRFYFDHSLQFKVGKAVISSNVFVGRKI